MHITIRLFIVIGFFIFSAHSSQAQLVTDRPDQTESSSTIYQNGFQMETGFSVDAVADYNEWSLFNNLMRYGITDNFELRLVSSLKLLDPTADFQSSLGIADMEIGAKYMFLQDAVEMAILAHLILPGGTEKFTNGSAGVITKLALSHEINERIGIGYNVGYDYLGKGSGNLTYATAVGFSLTGRIGFFVEFYGEIVDFEEFELLYDNGITYALSPNVQLDFSFGMGITSRSGLYSVGVSFRLPE